jgi:peptidoglycan/xylan/chitin deacetylase (PgdA/CDA1 family)
VLLSLAALAGSPPAGEPAAPGAGLAPAISRVTTLEPVVALTFDACATDRASYGFDRGVFETLKQEKVPATIFVSGRWVEAHPAEARELADEPLIELGNHSYRHPPFSQLTWGEARAEIQKTERAIAGLGRQSVGFRPPFGDWAGWLPRATGGLPLILWDVVSGDAGGHFRAASIVESVTSQVRPGSIVIFHINGRWPQTGEALPEIIRVLRERGMRFVQISELLRLPGAEVVRARPARYKKKSVSRSKRA